MNPQFIFAACVLVLTALIIFFDRKYGMLRDISTQQTAKPYSYSRVQLAWWMVIIVSSFIAVVVAKFVIPNLDDSTIILLGITGGTVVAAKGIDTSEKNNSAIQRNQNQPSEGFFLDILSDGVSVGVHRFQTILFNLTIGIWFIITVWKNLSSAQDPNTIIPVLSSQTLLLLGISAGTYAGVKSMENK